jgi:hypothetical protein
LELYEHVGRHAIVPSFATPHAPPAGHEPSAAQGCAQNAVYPSTVVQAVPATHAAPLPQPW